MQEHYVQDALESKEKTAKGVEPLHYTKSNTVLESSLPDSMMRKHKGIISVVSKKLMTSCSSVFTSAPLKTKTQRKALQNLSRPNTHRTNQ